MIPESSNKFYYRYVISDTSDTTLESYSRRIKKASHHATTHLLIDLTHCKNVVNLHLQFLLKNPSFKIQYLCKSNDFLALCEKPNISADHVLIFIENKNDLAAIPKDSESLLILSPTTTLDLQDLIAFYKSFENKERFFWSFKPYQKNIKKSVTLKDIYQTGIRFQTLDGLEITNQNIPEHYELEPLVDLDWSFSTVQRSLQISVIIPSYNNVTFLSNVLKHLFQQNLSAEKYEIIVVEDGGLDRTSEILKQLFNSYQDKINLKFIYWPKNHPQRGEQNFFRAGLARNLAMQFSEAEKIIFLDSDILVPPDFLETVLDELDHNELIQFQRYHIHQQQSLLNPSYKSIRLHTDTYVEEKNYWTQLFECENWMSLPHYWKYTCTYALGLHKKNFYKVGRFKKYYVSYGFEDTDLGYEFLKKGFRFKLIKKPLLHLTSYDQMQYKNSQIQRLKLLRKTAALFYLQHLNPQIYELFGNFYRFEKTIHHAIRDLF